MTPQNSLFVIKPYKWNGQWVFDDPDRNLVREPFVAGADVILDVATSHIPNADKGFLAVFSAGSFPGAVIVLEWVGEEGGGNIYRWPEQGLEGWLCPAMQKYLDPAPKRLYVQIKPASCWSLPAIRT
jgi:hypothetical protein